jgi:glucokinase
MKYLGIDIGGTNTKIALVTQRGETSLVRRFYYEDVDLSLDYFLEQVSSIVKSIASTAQEPCAGIGISCPGLQMEHGCGVLYSVNMPILNGFDIKKYFQSNFQLPVAVSNDLVAHSMAESSFGVGRDVDRFLSVSLGTGIGHTFIYKGKPQFSICQISGDSGRMILDPNSDLKDISGISGSAEALCGVHAIEALGMEYFGIEAKRHSAQEIITMARENDPTAVEIMSQISHRLGLFLVNLSVIYFPEVISVTGGQTEAGEFFVDECQKEFDHRSSGYFDGIMGYFGKGKKINILKADAGGLAGVLGSVVPLLK